MTATSACIVLCACPNPEVATAIASTVVSERLAACANRIDGMASLFHWQGALEQADESLLLLKTTIARYPALEARVRQLHPYEVAEILALPLLAGSAPYLDWLAAETAE